MTAMRVGLLCCDPCTATQRLKTSGLIDVSGDGDIGGSIVIEAKEVALDDATLDASGMLGGGEIKIGGGYQGQDASVFNAKNTVIGPDVWLKADAKESGDGGRVIVWADGVTMFMGNISAQALGDTGDGGFAEVSGKDTLTYRGTADLRAKNGAFGTLLLDPGGINVVTAAPGANELLDTDVVLALGFANVLITTVGASTGLDTDNADADFNNLTGQDVTATDAGTGDVDFLAGVRVIWNGPTLLSVNAERDINALNDVIIENTQSGMTIMEGVGGVDFLAGRDINVGDALVSTAAVAIGSEFGINRFVAGDTDFNGTPDATGDVNVIGGAATGSFALLGYRQTTLRGNDTGVATTGGVEAENGDITVRAGRNVNVTGGTNAGGRAFAQIGHGGQRAGLTSAAAIVSSNISVTSGVVVTGDVVLTGGLNDELNQAQIGHGITQFGSNAALTQGDISGDITVTAVLSDILLNATFTETTNGSQDFARAQIGSGASLLFNGSGLAGNEITHGNISGDITVDADDAVTLGAVVTGGAMADRYWIMSQIGHGAFARLQYDGTAVSGDRSLDATFGRIAEFDDISNAAVETTNISVTAGTTITVRAEETTQNSAGGVNGRKVDNLQRSQIGHGSFTTIDHPDLAVLDDGAGNGTLNVSVTEGDIAGDITVLDDNAALGAGVVVRSAITGSATATTFDAMIARIGHATANFLEAPSGANPVAGTNGFDGGSITVTQANILGARIDVRTSGVEGDNQRIDVETEIEADQASVDDSTAVAQIGHSGDVFAQSGRGGNGAAGNFISGNGGDITVNKGTVSDGLVHFSVGGVADAGTYGDNGGLLDDDANSSDDGNTDIIIVSSNNVTVDSDTAANTQGANRDNAESSIGHGHKLRLTTRAGGSNPTNPDTASGGRGGDILVTQQTPARDFGDGTSTATDDTARGLRGEIVIEATRTTGIALSVTADNAADTQVANNNSAFSVVGHGDIIEATTGDGRNGGTTANLVGAQVESHGGRGGHIDIQLSAMLIESDIQLQQVDVRRLVTDPADNQGGITGAVRIRASSDNNNEAANRNIVEAVIGHGQRIATHAGDGGTGGTANFLANSRDNFTTETGQDAFLVGFQLAGTVEGAAGDGAARGGNGGDIRVRQGDITDRVGTAGAFTHDGEADVTLVVTGNTTTGTSLTVQTSIRSGGIEGRGDDIFAGLGHHTRIYGEGGRGGAGGSTNTEFDNFIQPDSSGGRGGDVLLTNGNIRGDVIADVPRRVFVDSDAGHGTFTKVISNIGHTTDVVAVTQDGGNAGELIDGAANDGGIDQQDSGATVVFLDAHSADTNDSIERNGQDKFDIADLLGGGDGHPDDGIDTNGDGVMETETTLIAQFGGTLVSATDADGNRLHDVNGDGQFDFVDFDPDGAGVLTPDGKIDIVDVDRDGVYDKIDGRAGANGRLDYVTVTGLAFDRTHLEGGWTLQNTLTTASQLGGAAKFTALVGDFSNANGGRGGDAYTSVGFTIGDVEIDAGDPTLTFPDSLLVQSDVTDGIVNDGDDISIARVGHGAFQVSDTGRRYSNRAAGRIEALNGVGHVGAEGGGPANFAINAQGGRGGDVHLVQGAARDVDPVTAGAQNENDFLVGSVYVNVIDTAQPEDLRVGQTNLSSGKRVTVSSAVDAAADNNTSIAQIGHGALAFATGDGDGGDGASDGGAATTSSQTEIADGGRGGNAILTQQQLKGLIVVHTGADDGPTGDGDFSIQILANKGPSTQLGSNNDILVAQIGHGRIAEAGGGTGGEGDDGQLRANGGRGGDVTVTQAAILDTGITIDTFINDGGGNYRGNGLLIDSQVNEGDRHIVRAQAGHGDLAFLRGRSGNRATNESAVIENRNQTANGGRGGDATLNQDGYNYDITVDVGPNLLGGSENALQITSSVNTVNVGSDEFVLAALGHGGYGEVITNRGGQGGDWDGVNVINAGLDPNLRADVDPLNRIFLGTDRNGGRGGNATSNIGVNGTGRTLTGRIDFSIGDNEVAGNHADHIGHDDTTGAGITVTPHDDLRTDPTNADDGVLIQATAGQTDNHDNALNTNTAIAGHHGFNRALATAATGGPGIDATLVEIVSEGNGGEGGDATSTIGFIEGVIIIDNTVDLTTANNGGAAESDIIVQALGQLATDNAAHRAEARVGHLVSGEALAGAGGNAATPSDLGADNYSATISARGGDGGDALATQNRLNGQISLTAENTVLVFADSVSTGDAVQVAGVGHRLENDARAGAGGLSGDTRASLAQFNSLYFVYEALLEFDSRVNARVTAGATLEDALNAAFDSDLSMFEQKLVRPFFSTAAYKATTTELVTNGKDAYFDDKFIGHFLDKMLEGQRDNNMGPTIPAFIQEEIDTLLALMAAGGDGGSATSTQGGLGTSTAENRSASGNIRFTASSRDLTDVGRGVIVRSRDGVNSTGMEIAHVGHQSELIRALGGAAGNVRDHSNGIGGDGGNATVTQFSFEGSLTLVSGKKLTVEALDTALGGGRQRAWVGHRLNIGPDDPLLRVDPIVVGGAGGSEEGVNDDGYNGNGGDVYITQFGAVSNDTDTNINISLSAPNDALDPDNVSILIRTVATGASSPDAETHVGHDIQIASVKAGDAGQQLALEGPAGLDEGVLEGNGGDIRIRQTDLGADIDIVGRDIVQVLANTSTAGGNDAHTIIGLERTIGDSADTDNGLTGTIVAGNGGDTITEHVTDTSEINPSPSTPSNGTAQVEDADGGVIYITLGTISDSQQAGDFDTDVITITSLREDLDVISTAALGDATIEIGNHQQLIALSGEGGLQRGTTAKTAGEGGDIRITRGEISGEITLEALDQGDANNKQVFVNSVANNTVAEVRIGHETEFDVTTGRSGFGVSLLDVLLTGLGMAVTDIQLANLRFTDIKNTAGAIALAFKNLDRYSAADQATLTTARDNANTAFAAAQTAFAALKAGGTEAAFIAAIETQRTAVLAQLNAADGVTGFNQLGDHADGGDILYTANDFFNNNTAVANEGQVSGNILLISGFDSNANGTADTFLDDDGVVNVTSTTTLGTTQTEIGHLRRANNLTGIGGGLTNGPPTGGVSGDGGSITVGNPTGGTIGDVAMDATVTGDRTIGNVTLTANEVVVSSGGGGGTAETHLGHDVELNNTAARSDIEVLLGNGGDINSAQTTTGGVTILANHLSSTIAAENSRLAATGAADSIVHLGHQADTNDISDSDPGVGGTGTDDANRGGEIIVAQNTSGGVAINLDLDADNNPSDLNIDARDAGTSKVRLGHEVNNNGGGTIRSGNLEDDGADVTVSQVTGGDISTTEIEDLLIHAIGASGGNDVFIGHDAVLLAQSGETGQNEDEFGGLVDADQTITGNLTFNTADPDQPLRSFEATTGATAGEVHIGHEGTLTARSADDGAMPAPGARAVDVDADQLIQAEITVRAGEILVSNASGDSVQLGHEAFINVDTDGAHATAGVNSRSFINPSDAANDNDDIVLVTVLPTAVNLPANDDAALTGTADGLDGDITIQDITNAGNAQVGHRSTSTVSHNVPGNQPAGVFDTLHAIGGARDGAGTDLIALNADGTVTNTASSTITIDAARDLEVLGPVAGVAQIGHFISEEQAALNAADAVQATSQVRQVVGSDIVIGDGTPASTTGVGNNLVISSAVGGRAEIGHRSPVTNEFQVDGGVVITPQILDGDITIEVGVDADTPVPDGLAAGDTAAGGDDDTRIIATAGAGTARIGHNQTNSTETSGNTTQVAAGDIWLRGRGDVHVLSGDIGHEHYRHNTAAGTINAETAVAMAGLVRNRIRGLTTIGAGQNSPAEDSVLTAGVLTFDGTAGGGSVGINSGYSDVGGQLRIYIPAQENLTVIATVNHNDSAAGGGDPVTPRAASPTNIFLGTGGQDHENGFLLQGAIAQGTSNRYVVTGTGNYAYYFGVLPSAPSAASNPSLEIDIDLIKPLRPRLHTDLGGGFDCWTGTFGLSDPYATNVPNHPGYFGIEYYDDQAPRWYRRLERTPWIEYNSWDAYRGTGSVAGSHCQGNIGRTTGDDDFEDLDDDDIVVGSAPENGESVIAGSNIAEPVSTTAVDPLVTVVPGAGQAIRNPQYGSSGPVRRQARLLRVLAQAGGGVALR